MTAVNTELTPNVAMNEGIRSREIISHDNTPTPAPASNDSAIATGIPHPPVDQQPCHQDRAQPHLGPHRKIQNTAAIGTTRPTATRHVIA